MGKKVWLNGELVEADQASVSVFDHGLLYGDGVFEGIRVYKGRIFKLASHLRRLKESADAIRLVLQQSLDEIDAATRQVVAANGIEDGYIRLCVTRGIGTLGISPDNCTGGTTFIIADTIALYPNEFYQNGLAIITAKTIRNHPKALSPRIKSLNYLNNIMAKIEALDAGVLEAVMLNSEGNVAECTGDNVFVVKDNVLITPPVEAGMLEGITMNTVIGLALENDVAMSRVDLAKDDLYNADEMFLTGTAAEVIPVTTIDSRTIGDGKPGPVTRKLLDAFHALVANAPED
jgi:branched-chain amino acid aminotransferase